MVGRWSRSALLALGLFLLAAAGAQAQDGQARDGQAQALPHPLNLVPSAPEEIGRVPQHLVWIRQGLQAMQDPLDGQLVFVDDEGRVIGRASLPPAFEIADVVSEKERIRLVDESGGRQVVVDRTIEPTAAGRLEAADVRASRDARQVRFHRRGPQQLVYEEHYPTGARQIEVRSVTGGTLGHAYEIGPPDRDERFIVTEEIVGENPLQVRVFAQRHDPVGRLTGVAFLSLDEMDVVPRNFVTLTDDGRLRVLVPTAAGVRIREIAFSDPPAARVDAGKPGDETWRSLGLTSGEFLVESRIVGVNNGAEQRRSDGVRFRVNVQTPPIARDQVLKNARAYLAVNWVLASDNFAKAGVENLCRPEAGKFWRRPIGITRGMVGREIGPMPYRWGGDDSPESFRVRIEWGALAGDICTCRDAHFDYCLVQSSAGVDCSGFVSQAWGIAKRGTSGLMDVANELHRLDDMRPGDAFNRPGRHVRLFVRRAQGASLSFTVLESSTRRDCEGVCERTYRPSEMNGYRLIRYRGIVN